MPGLWEVLGYDDIAADVLDHLNASDRSILIEGPPGAGKSWLGKGIGAVWESGGGQAIVAEGDVSRSELDYYPFGFAMSGLGKGWNSLAPGAFGVARAAETIFGSAGIVTSTLQGLAGVRRSRRRAPVYLGSRENEIMRDLQRLGRKRPILLIADNLHWWDKASMTLLRALCEPRTRASHPFLDGFRVILIRTPEPFQTVSHAAEHRALMDSLVPRKIELQRVPAAGFGDVLTALGAPGAIAETTATAIHSLSGGHLALAGKVVTQLASDTLDALVATSDADSFVRALVTDRVRELGEMGPKATDLLRVAAVLGLAFEREEVQCATGLASAETSELLRYCRDERLFEFDNRTIRFAHDVFRQVFLNDAESESPNLHARLADCLRRIRPAEYALRATHMLAAEEPREAAALVVLDRVKRLRDGLPLEALAPELADVLASERLGVTLERFIAAFGHLRQYEFAECLAVLDTLPLDDPKALRAEADYLRGMALLATRSEVDRARGRSLLGAWSTYHGTEPEIGNRLDRLRLYGLSHHLDKEAGRVLEGEIQGRLFDRLEFDRSAKDDLYTMYRCAGSLYPPEVALSRCVEAVTHFGPDEDGAIVRRPAEYYRCLVNLGANQIANAKYSEAVDTHVTLVGLQNDFPADTFPRPDFPAMNELLARYRANELTAASAAAQQRKIVQQAATQNDPFYCENALAVFLALAGELDEALSILDALDNKLHATRSEPEPSMAYLVANNRCGVRHLRGDQNRALDEWDELRPTVEAIPYVIRPFLLRRHSLLRQVFEMEDPLSPTDFDEYLPWTYPSEIGPQWDNYGRGFRMPEVEFWREN